MAKSFTCRVITPEGVILDRPAVAVRLPAYDGLMGVLYDHAPMITLVGQGGLSMVDADGRVFVVQMAGGFAEVRENVLTVLADQAQPAAEGTIEAHLRPLEEARRELTEKPARPAAQGSKLEESA
jgi:F-type H+-transporting ATPase subunit epsilon